MSLYLEVGMGFIVGALAVPTLSIGADRFGSKVAGAFAGFPATVGASLFFLGRSQGPVAAASAASIIPFMEGLLGIFLTVFAVLSFKGLKIALPVAFLVWAFFVSLPLFVFDVSILQSLFALIFCLIVSFFILEKVFEVPSTKAREIKLSKTDITVRMLIGGSVVGLAIYLGSVLGPIAGGVIAAFPAVVVSTLIVIYRTSGPHAATAFSKSLLLNALINAGVFATVAHFTYLPLGVMGGTIAGFLAASMSGLFLWSFILRKVK